MSRVLSLAVVLVACSKPVSKPPEAKRGSAPAPVKRQPTTASGACTDGFRAAADGMVGGNGAYGNVIVTIECKHGQPSITSDYTSTTSRQPPPDTFAISIDAWSAVWKKLEDAHWRELAERCPDNSGNSEVPEYLQLDLEISDGTTTKTQSCEQRLLTAQHRQIVDALHDALISVASPPAKS